MSKFSLIRNLGRLGKAGAKGIGRFGAKVGLKVLGFAYFGYHYIDIKVEMFADKADPKK